MSDTCSLIFDTFLPPIFMSNIFITKFSNCLNAHTKHTHTYTNTHTTPSEIHLFKLMDDFGTINCIMIQTV